MKSCDPFDQINTPIIPGHSVIVVYSGMNIVLRIEEVTTPVELVSFYGEAMKSSIVLNWETASETNNSHFTIEKSIDGQAFEMIGEIEGSGTTAIPQYYNFTDKNPAPGIQYYRLQQVDFDGQFEFHQTIAVQFDEVAKQLTVFPNPTNVELNLRFGTPPLQDEVLTLYNSIGEMVWRKKVPPHTEKLSFNLEDLARGHYFLKYINQRTPITIN